MSLLKLTFKHFFFKCSRDDVDVDRNRHKKTSDESASTMELAHHLLQQHRPRESSADAAAAPSFSRHSTSTAASQVQAHAAARDPRSSRHTTELNTMELAHLVVNRGDAVNSDSSMATMDVAHLLIAPQAAAKNNNGKKKKDAADSSMSTMDLAHVIAEANKQGAVDDEEEDGDDDNGADNIDDADLNTMDLARFVSQPQRTRAVAPRPAAASRGVDSSQDTMDIAHHIAVRRSVEAREEDGLTTMDLANLIAKRNGPSIAEILNDPAPTPEIMRKPQHTWRHF